MSLTPQHLPGEEEVGGEWGVGRRRGGTNQNSALLIITLLLYDYCRFIVERESRKGKEREVMIDKRYIKKDRSSRMREEGERQDFPLTLFSFPSQLSYSRSLSLSLSLSQIGRAHD